MPSETLGGIEDLFAWLAGTAKMPTEIMAAAYNRLRRHPNDTTGLFADAIGPHREMLAQAEDGYAWDVKTIDASVAGFLAPVLWSAADLLTHANRRRVRRCANDACLWLFVDESKAGTRRWCDMSSCGNRAKSRRHYLKTKTG